MFGKNLASGTAKLGAGIASLCGGGAAVFSTIEGVTGTAGAAGFACNPSLLAASALAGIGVLAADQLRGKKSEDDHDVALQTLIRIFNDTDSLTRRLPFAGKLIEEHLASGKPIEDLHIPEDDPGHPSLALYKTIVLYKAGTDAQLQEILSRLPAINPAPTSSTAPEDNQTAILIEENTSALLYLIGEETQEIRETLSAHVTLIQDVHDALPRFESKLNYSIRQNDEILEILRELRAAKAQARQTSPKESEEANFTRACEILETKFALPAGTLENELPALADRILAAKDTTEIDKANALFAKREFAEAETQYLLSDLGYIQAIEKATHELRNMRIQSLQGAAQSACAQIEYARALTYYREAAALTSIDRDPCQWAEIHHQLAFSLDDNGNYREATDILRQVVAIREKHLSETHPDTLTSRSNLANTLFVQGKHAEAEMNHRMVLAIRQRILGQEHPDTLQSRNNLANVLNSLRKYAEAEREHRAVLLIRERVLDPGHIKTLESRNNLANSLCSQGKYTEAEIEHRVVLAIREKILGSERPAVFQSCFNLSLCLEGQRKFSEALIFARRALEGWIECLGPDHPRSKRTKRKIADLESFLPSSQDGCGDLEVG